MCFFEARGGFESSRKLTGQLGCQPTDLCLCILAPESAKTTKNEGRHTLTRTQDRPTYCQTSVRPATWAGRQPKRASYNVKFLPVHSPCIHQTWTERTPGYADSWASVVAQKSDPANRTPGPSRPCLHHKTHKLRRNALGASSYQGSQAQWINFQTGWLAAG